MLGSQRCDVLVAGAGPVGLFTALELKRRGFDVRVIDRDERTNVHSYALALQGHTLSVLREAGIADSLLEAGRRIDKISFYDRNECRATLDLARLPGEYKFVLIVPQSALESLLETALRDRGVHVDWNRELVNVEDRGDSVEAGIVRLGYVPLGYPSLDLQREVISRGHVHASYVVGADGFYSTVRRLAGLDYESVGPRHHYSVFEMAQEDSSEGDARIVLDEAGANVLWPLTEGRCRWTFEITPEEFHHPGPGPLSKFIAQRAPWFRLGESDPAWTAKVTFENRLASHFGKGRLWLAGESAHMTLPFAVRSLNEGLCEGADLARRLVTLPKGSTAGAATPGILQEYDATCLANWRRLLQLGGSIRTSSETSPWVREHAAAIIAATPASGSDLEALLAQVGLEITG